MNLIKLFEYFYYIIKRILQSTLPSMHVHMSTHTNYGTINTVLFKVRVLGTRGTIQTAEQLQLMALQRATEL
jgi:hypothetical protein